MAEVTFPEELGGGGLVVTDDANPDTGLAAGGHRLRFVPALAGAVAMARTAAQKAALAQELANQTSDDRRQTGEDRTATHAAAEATSADREQTGLDRQATAGDAVATKADRKQTALDRTANDENAQATAADRKQTGLDRTATSEAAEATAADRKQTGLDRTTTGENVVATAADRQQTGLDREASAGSARAAAAIVDMLQIAFRGQRTGVEIIAHRGFKSVSIQNTLLALTTCIDGGADSLEFDVQMTMDGVPVLFHDNEMSPLTSGADSIAEHTWDWISGKRYLQADDTAYDGVGIPALAEVLAYIQHTQCRFYPEIKNYRTPADIDAYVSAIQGARLSALCCWQSFTPSDLERVRELDASCEVGFLSSSTDQASLEALADQASQHLPASLLLKTTSVSTQPGIVAYARARGVDVGVWTLDTRAQRQQMERLGVTRLMCDRNVRG
jgi:glycerophosphoryl diester phosphodiesterase